MNLNSNVSGKRAFFLDRDGTLNEEVGYIRRLDQMHLISHVPQAIQTIQANGYLALLATNQSGVARGYYPLSWIDTLHTHLQDLLKKEAVSLDGLYICPHRSEDACTCRKPKTGLLDRAKEEHTLDLQECVVVGDKATDILLGKAVGATTILVKTGYGERVCQGTYQSFVSPHFVAEDLWDGVRWFFSVPTSR